jgi:acetoin:2,6-dichlorophenolindophenol oxidoreductase subunit alpha
MIYSPSEVIRTFKMDEIAKTSVTKSLLREKLACMLEQMYLTRFFEENAEDLYMRGLVHGTMHLSIGMEASPIGSIAAIEPNDLIIHHHRGHGHTIAKGADLVTMVAEFIGKDAGYCGGHGGSMHIHDIENGNWGATGIVAGGLSMAVGIALALKLRHEKRILLSFFGDGSTSEGEWHESLNIASIWKLPVVFICDNNQYGMSMPANKVMNVDHVADRAAAYNIPGKTVDGNDPIAVYDAVKAAAQRARSGDGPTLLEHLTYRWRGHSKSDRNLYRTTDEIDEWKRADPIPRFAIHLMEARGFTEEEIDAIEQKAKNDILNATEIALTLPEPDPMSVEDEVYAP